MKLHKIIEMYLKYDNMHTIGTINGLICINNYVNSCINCMLSTAISHLPHRYSRGSFGFCLAEDVKLSTSREAL